MPNKLPKVGHENRKKRRKILRSGWGLTTLVSHTAFLLVLKQYTTRRRIPISTLYVHASTQKI